MVYLNQGDKNEERQNDPDIVMAAVKETGWALKYASETLKSDKEIVMAAVKEWRGALKYADEKLKDDMRRVLVLAPAGKKVSFLTKLKLCTILRDSKLKLNEALEIREHLV